MSAYSFRILDPAVPDDFAEWLAVWSRTSHREVQAHPAYGIALYPPTDRLLGAVAQSPGGTVILPFAVREIPITSHQRAHDAITPYGYGGAYLDGQVDANWFWGSWDRWAQDHGLVGITVRSHLFDEAVLPLVGPSVQPLSNIVIDLEQSEDRIWAAYDYQVRNHIRRGRSFGIEITVDENCENLEAFHRLYLETMGTLGADEFYSFDRERLGRMVTSLGTGVALFHAHLGGQLVASEMQLIGARNAYYFLSGSNDAGRRARANPVMKHEVITWLKAKGLQRYVLGGGRTRDDSLFKYKRAYAPKATKEFTISFHESQAGRAEEMVAARRLADPEWNPSPGFIPEYRAPTAVSEVRT